MKFLISLLIGLATFLYLPENLRPTKKAASEHSFSKVELYEVVESLRMCLQSGLSVAAAFVVLNESSIQSPLIRQAKANIAIGLPVLQGLGAKDADYATKLLVSLLERNAHTGGTIDKSLFVMSQQLRSESHASRIKRIRSVAVKSVLPLGLCFLPAFVLVCVVPIAMSLGHSLLN